MVAHEVTVPVETLRRLLRPARPLHIRRAAHKLLLRRDTWTRLDADLRLLAARDPDLAEAARSDLGSWMARDAATVYGRPSEEARAALVRLLEDARDELPEAVGARVRWQLGVLG